LVIITIMKAISKGTMPMFNTCLKVRTRFEEAETVVTSFCINKISNTTIPINAKEPAMATVVTVETVEVVTVDIMIFPIKLSCGLVFLYTILL
jgi:hypothetical protein